MNNYLKNLVNYLRNEIDEVRKIDSELIDLYNRK